MVSIYWGSLRNWEVGVVRILIWVVFFAQGSICTFDISFGGVLVNAKKLGAISNSHVVRKDSRFIYILYKNLQCMLQAVVYTATPAKLKGATCFAPEMLLQRKVQR